LKKILIIFLLIYGFELFPQNFNMNDPIPFDKNIVSGQLDNGLKYFIRKNSKPENRIELRLVVNAGSILEDEDQQGLAHFVEHMAFNGSKNFERNELVNYLESIGMKFGPDINAYTSFDETVYMLQLPADKEDILFKGFQILEDWAYNLNFDETEIDKERGVIIEEWRLGRGAGARIRDKQFPVLFKNSQYAERLPIGKKEILDNFEYETLKRFYKEWYRPDLMAVIAVGDLEIEKIEKLIKKHFSRSVNTDEFRERKLYEVPDHLEILVAKATDPEATSSSVIAYYKLPDSQQGTIEDFKITLTEALYNRMLAFRLNELTQQADPPFVMGYSSKGQFIRTKEFYALGAVVKDDALLKGLETVLTEGQRVKRFGFTESEVARHKDQMLRYIESSYNERDKKESAKFAGEYIRHFLTGEPTPGIEYEYELQKFLIPSITTEEVNALASKWMTKSNIVIMVSAPEKEGLSFPSDEEFIRVFESVEGKEIEPYNDNINEAPLLAKIPTPGKVISEKNIENVGVIEWELSNGIKVVLKPTDFKNDEISFRAFSPGGTSLVTDEDYIAAATASQLVNQSGAGTFDNIQLQKQLSGKIVRVSPYISELTEGISGSASPKDIETMFQLISLYASSPRIDSSSYMAYRSRVSTLVVNREMSPESAFQDTLSLTMAQYHPRRYPWTIKTLDEMDMNKSFEIFKERFKDFSDFTFIFVGNFNPSELKPLVETYLGSLPSVKRKEDFADVGIRAPKGVIKKEVRKGMEQKSVINLIFTGPYTWSFENSYLLQSLTSAFRIKIREVLREDKGGTYGVKVASSGKRAPEEEYAIDISFGCNPDRVDELTAILFEQIDSLVNYPLDQSYIEKVQEIQRRELETGRKENEYWLSNLQSYYFYGMDLNDFYKRDELIEKLNAEDLLKTAKKYFNKDNYVIVVLYPEKTS
jgi:zinc protease